MPDKPFLYPRTSDEILAGLDGVLEHGGPRAGDTPARAYARRVWFCARQFERGCADTVVTGEPPWACESCTDRFLQEIEAARLICEVADPDRFRSPPK